MGPPEKSSPLLPMGHPSHWQSVWGSPRLTKLGTFRFRGEVPLSDATLVFLQP